MEQPEGFTEGDPKQLVCLLKKALYGTKQGGNRWNRKMRTVLESLEFSQIYSDAAVYGYVKGDIHLILSVFVDDMTLLDVVISHTIHLYFTLIRFFIFSDDVADVACQVFTSIYFKRTSSLQVHSELLWLLTVDCRYCIFTIYLSYHSWFLTVDCRVVLSWSQPWLVTLSLLSISTTIFSQSFT